MNKIGSMRILTVLGLLIWMVSMPLIAGAVSYEQGAELAIDKTSYAPGESIRVQFSASGNWARDAWIGIIPSNIPHGSEPVNDQHDITYQYIEKRTSGVMVFTAPGAGQWDLRMHDTDGNGREVAYVSFTVGQATPKISDANLVLEKTVFSPGESIRVQFSASNNWARDAWIGIIPSNIPHGSEPVNDQHDITYQYIEKRTSGVMVFTAPGPGHWDFRMNDADSNGREVSYVSFTVGQAQTAANSSNNNLVLEKIVFSPGESIRVQFSASSNWARDAWIGIIPSNIPHGSEPVNDQHDITYQYIEKRTSGVMVFTAPGPGHWDFRMNDADSNGREVGHVSFTVQ